MVLKFFIFISFVLTNSLFALGTYSEGWMIVKILKFESKGIIFDSYEGILEFSSFSKDEICNEENDECYSIKKEKISFSVRPETYEAVNLINKNINRELLINYQIHRITAISLSSDFEIVQAFPGNNLPREIEGDEFIVSKTGSKRNFSIFGKILKIEYQGTLIGTYEGLYLDETTSKIHPFSITDENMAYFAMSAMKSTNRYYMGISVSYTKGFRKTYYDIFEINFKSPAGGI